MRKRVDVLIRYEHKARELESIMLVKIEMERRGYSVDLIGNYEYDREEFPRPRLFIAPAVYDDRQLRWDLFRYGLLKKIANLQWEQLLGIEEEEDPNADHNIRGIGQRIVNFCWSERTRDRIIRGGVQDSKAPVVGQMSTDLLRWDFKKMLLAKKQLGLKNGIDPDKEWYLFISTFAYCEMNQLQEQLTIKAWGKENVEYFVDLSIKSRAAILDWFEQCIIEHPEVVVIYRPHPDEAERFDRLKQMAQRYTNFRVITQEALKQWVNACDKVYNWYSTGMVDAVVLDKPVRLLRPYPIKKELDYRIMVCANSITTKQEFDADFLDESKVEIIDEQLFNSYYFLPDKPVYLLVCDILEEMLNSNKYDVKYTIGEKLLHARDVFKWRCFWFVDNRIISKLPEHLYPTVYKRALVARKERLDTYRNGYKKNVATKDEIEELYNRLKPLVYSFKR